MTTLSRRYVLDPTTVLVDDLLIGGTPLTLLRLTDAGRDTVEQIRSGEPVSQGRLLERLLATGIATPLPDDRPITPRSTAIVTPTFGPPRYPTAPGTVVVDDGSTPPVDGATVRNERNLGPAAARNRGWRAVLDERPDTELFVFLDADVDTRMSRHGDGEWWEPLLAHFDDRSVGLVAPRVRAPAAGSTITDRAERAAPALDLGPDGGRVAPNARITYAPSAAIVVRASALLDIGGFDETLRTGEDVDLVWRLHEQGWVCVYEPSVTVEHAARPSLAGWLAQRLSYGRSAAALATRHGAAVAPWRTSHWGVAVVGALSFALARRRPRVLLPALITATTTIVATLSLARRIGGLPRSNAGRIVGRGLLRSTAAALSAIRRCWWPMLLPVLAISRTARRLTVVSMLCAGHPARLAADLAYGAGTALGAIEHRSARALLPVLSAGRLAPQPTDTRLATDHSGTPG